MAKTMLSIDIGSSRIKFVEGLYKKGKFNIKEFGQLPISENSIRGERIKNINDISSDISNYLNAHKFKAKNAIVTLNGVEAVIRDVDLPQANPNELNEMIKNEMIHTFHANEENVIQYKLVEKFKDDEGTQLNKFRVASLSPDIINDYDELLKILKLSPVAMDINFNCIDKFFSTCTTVNEHAINEKTVMFIDFGADNTTVYINSNGKQKIFRHLNIGASEIEKIISDEMVSTPKEIKAMKENGADFFSSEGDNEEYYRILKPYFYNLIEELRNIIRFYMNRIKSEFVSQIFIMGGGSNLYGICEYLQNGLNIPVEKIVKTSNMNQKQPIHEHLNAIGALIRN